MQSYLKETDLPKLEQLVVTKSWWDTVDILDRVVGSLVYEHPELEEIILILFENLFKPNTFRKSLQTTSASSATSKLCFEQPTASFLVCSLILIEYQWSLSDNIWLRRVAIDHQLLRKEKTNTQLMEKILLHNLNQTEFFINKAIGWTLRDYSKTNPTWVTCFIEKNRERMAELSIKEASKYL
ncbi:DNA alkylation repair enzyme, truncation [Streptococcus pneumoniae]|nr:DNA alkylation repair enzyme, truncation [Streptococcus pneumoniae]